MSLSSGTSSALLTGYTPVQWYHFCPQTIVLILLPVLSILGGLGTWGLASRNGLLAAFPVLFAQEVPNFPGADAPLLQSFTGVKRVDHQLSILVAFFAPCLDLSHGDLTLFAFQAFGQFGAAWTLMMMESMRLGNSGAAVSWIGLVGIIFQNITFAVTVPLWLLLHIVTSTVAKPFPGTHANRVLLVRQWDLRILPIAIIFGYLLPALLMALPSPDSTHSMARQKYIAFWHAFPIWTVCIHGSLNRFCQWMASKIFTYDPNGKPQTQQGASYLNNVKHVYRFVLALCMSTHIPVVVIALLPSWAIPDSAPTLAFLRMSNPIDIFVPYFPFHHHEVENLAEGVHTFLIWDLYIGSAALLMWAILLYRNACTEKAIVDPSESLPQYKELLLGRRAQDEPLWKKLLPKIAFWTVVSGPIGALAILLWERDTIVRQKIKQGL